jgi:hypothetical protein
MTPPPRLWWKRPERGLGPSGGGSGSSSAMAELVRDRETRGRKDGRKEGGGIAGGWRGLLYRRAAAAPEGEMGCYAAWTDGPTRSVTVQLRNVTRRTKEGQRQ